eukprot:CAMPEP_0205812704 /NCGR_PEP_ID=MMETSP0205-20121125/17241_1 /ASSEMBLY_ACC=CAM_ASM_000278 /TAXON_ID=36767 /ORGANISM="Euplotes focardii, Strain TN1" /LENGTH=99 /DNA_ID=CAMNT_0053093815 /DNA_START=236 /DNA_END=532 /DNA_ORIENTATION=-
MDTYDQKELYNIVDVGRYEYKPVKYKPLMDPISSDTEKKDLDIPEEKEPHDHTTAPPSVNSDRLYRKNMESTVGDLLRWDSTKGKYTGGKGNPFFHNKV